MNDIPARNTPATREPLRAALLLAGLFATITFLLHFLSSIYGTRLGYGFFRDELYYLVCGHHLDWGYVDQPPLVAIQARLAESLFGLTPTGIRIFSFAAGAIKVALTGLLAWQFGGRRSAQALAMTAALAVPLFLALDNFLSMNAWDPCFWMACLFVLLRIADGSWSPRWWLLFGLFAGLGIENKHAMAFFLFSLLIALIISPQRRILWSRWAAAGIGVILLLALPNLLWQWQHHWATYELLSGIAKSDKNIKLPPIPFILQQLNGMLFFTAPLWIGGLLWLAFARRAIAWRFAAITFLFFFVLMMAMHAKDYYLAPIYPILLAAGAVALVEITRRNWPAFAYSAFLAICLIGISIPLTLTIMPPSQYTAYAAKLGQKNNQSEKFSSPLPQFLSDRFGWDEMVQGFAARYNALPPEERAHTGIFCHNYGEASAVNMFGSRYGLPTAISGHQNYFYWGWNNYTGESMLTLGGDPKRYADSYEEVIDLGAFDAPWIMDFEHNHYLLLKHRKRPYAQDWPEFKFWY